MPERPCTDGVGPDELPFKTPTALALLQRIEDVEAKLREIGTELVDIEARIREMGMRGGFHGR